MNLSKRAVLLGLMAPVVGAARAAGYPEPGRSIRIVVPFAAGGGTDVITRTVAEHVARQWDTSIVIDNRPGGGTMIGTQAALAAPPDGYTLLAIANSYFIAPLLVEKAPYDPASATTGIALMAASPHVLVVHPSIPARTIAELVAYVKGATVPVNYASFGRGSSSHLGFERLKRALGIEATHLPYPGSAPAIKDLIGGHVQMMLGDLQNVQEQLAAGMVRAIAVASETRLEALPAVPTIAESGIAGFTSKSYFGLVARSGTDPAIAERWNGAVRAALQDANVRGRLAGHGVAISDLTLAQMRAFMAAEADLAASSAKLVASP